MGDRATLRRAGGEKAAARLKRVRPGGTTQKYDRWQKYWGEFCEIGDGYRPYQEFTFTLWKWHLFIGWLEDLTEDRDLNMIRSAINRHLSDNHAGRPIKGVDVTATIADWAATQDAKKRLRGEEPGLNRVPCPEAAVRRLLDFGERADARTLGWVALLLVQLVCWLRADSCAGFEDGDIVVTADDTITVAVRYMKNKKAFRTQPGLIQIAAPQSGKQTHARRRLIRVVRRANRRCPGWQQMLNEAVKGNPNSKGGSEAAMIMTAKMRDMTRGVVVPKGSTVSSHSWREMGAVASYKANYDMMRMCERGFWKDPATMWGSYIQPFLDFPRSDFLAELYDDLA
jgi:hypothetical protein